MEQLDRIPPQNIEAEQATLGSMMLARKYAAKGEELLNSADFYRPSHGEVFEAICAVNARDEPLDMISVQEELRNRGQLAAIGGTEYLMALFSQVPSGSRVAHYAKIVKNKSRLRSLILFAHEIAGTAWTEENPEVVYSTAFDKLIDLRAGGDGSGFRTLQDAIKRAMDAIEKRSAGKGKIAAPKIGIPGLDALSWGLDPGVTIIAAQTGLGKTSFMLNIIERNPDVPSAMFELEMGDEQLAERLLVSKAGMDSFVVRSGMLDDEECHKLNTAANTLHNLKLIISDSAVNISQMMAMTQGAIIEHKIKAVYLDYIGLLDPKPGQRTESRNLELGAMAKALKHLSRTANIPVIFACQLSRKHQDRTDKRPTLRDLRDSGELEQHTDRAIFIHDPDRKEGANYTEKRKVELILAKNRYGPTGTVEAWWEGKTFTFTEVEKHHEEDGGDYHDYTQEY